MSDILLINRPMQGNKIAQDARGTTFSRGALPWYPPFRPRASSKAIVALQRGKSQTVEDGVDAAVPVDAQNAPTRDLENCTHRSFPQRPHRSSFFTRGKEQRRTLQVCQSDCLNRGVHPTIVCQLVCQRGFNRQVRQGNRCFSRKSGEPNFRQLEPDSRMAQPPCDDPTGILSGHVPSRDHHEI